MRGSERSHCSGTDASSRTGTTQFPQIPQQLHVPNHNPRIPARLSLPLCSDRAFPPLLPALSCFLALNPPLPRRQPNVTSYLLYLLENTRMENSTTSITTPFGLAAMNGCGKSGAELLLSGAPEVVAPKVAKPSAEAKGVVPSFAEAATVSEGTAYVLNLIHSDELSVEMQDQMMMETIKTW